jgi:hypothetical protein
LAKPLSDEEQRRAAQKLIDDDPEKVSTLARFEIALNTMMGGEHEHINTYMFIVHEHLPITGSLESTKAGDDPAEQLPRPLGKLLGEVLPLCLCVPLIIARFLLINILTSKEQQ